MLQWIRELNWRRRQKRAARLAADRRLIDADKRFRIYASTMAQRLYELETFGTATTVVVPK